MHAVTYIGVTAAHAAGGAQFLGHRLNHLLRNAVSLALSLSSELVLHVRLHSDLDVGVVHQVRLVTLSDPREIFKDQVAALLVVQRVPQAICVFLRECDREPTESLNEVVLSQFALVLGVKDSEGLTDVLLLVAHFGPNKHHQLGSSVILRDFGTLVLWLELRREALGNEAVIHGLRGILVELDVERVALDKLHHRVQTIELNGVL